VVVFGVGGDGDTGDGDGGGDCRMSLRAIRARPSSWK
jgi:hypothetical protein